MQCKECGRTMKSLGKDVDECPDCGAPLEKPASHPGMISK